MQPIGAKPVFENTHYTVTIGLPPPSREFPVPYDCYLVHNKDTKVLEYFHSILPHVLHYVKTLDYALDHPEPATPEEAQETEILWGEEPPAKEEKPN